MKHQQHVWFEHVVCHDTLYEAIPQGTVEDKQRRGRLRKSWTNSIKECTGYSVATFVNNAEDRVWWHTMIIDASIMTPLQPMPRITGWDEMREAYQRVLHHLISINSLPMFIFVVCSPSLSAQQLVTTYWVGTDFAAILSFVTCLHCYIVSYILHHDLCEISYYSH